MDAHWAARPAVMDEAIIPDQLSTALREPLARRLSETVHQYLVHFHAHRVYLHRVAFRHYPRQEKVSRAMGEILRLAKMDASNGSVLPLAFKWPLFMVGLEAEPGDRAWIEGALSSMASAGDPDHAGAEMTVQVLRVITQRQDAGDRVVDSMMVRDELFRGSLNAI